MVVGVVVSAAQITKIQTTYHSAGQVGLAPVENRELWVRVDGL